MGASTFFDEGKGATPQEAFQALVEEAQWESGHGGYTGTIAEKDGFTLILRTFETDTEAYAYAQHLIDVDDERVDDKWGPAGALALPEDGGWLFFGWASD